MELHPNDTARESRPTFWLFTGRWALVPVIGAGLFLIGFNLLPRLGFDIVWTLLVSLAPAALGTLYVVAFVNGRPQSYAFDLLILALFRFRQWCWIQGVFERPPELVHAERPRHPKEFMQ